MLARLVRPLVGTQFQLYGKVRLLGSNSTLHIFNNK